MKTDKKKMSDAELSLPAPTFEFVGDLADMSVEAGQRTVFGGSDGGCDGCDGCSCDAACSSSCGTGCGSCVGGCNSCTTCTCQCTCTCTA
jgi:hypothetical protein